MWRNGNTGALMVVVQKSTAALENSLGVLKKLKIEIPCDPARPFLII